MASVLTCQSPPMVSTTPCYQCVVMLGSTFGPVGDFAAAVLTKGSTHYRVNKQVVVKLPGSFTRDTTSRGLVDEEVYDRGPIWTNKELVETGADDALGHDQRPYHRYRA